MYIYIYRYIFIHIHTYTYISVYIYIYTSRARGAIALDNTLNCYFFVGRLSYISIHIYNEYVYV